MKKVSKGYNFFLKKKGIKKVSKGIKRYQKVSKRYQKGYQII